VIDLVHKVLTASTEGASSVRSTTISTKKRRLSPEEALAELERIRANIAEDLKDLTPAEQEALFDRWIEDVNDGLRQVVLRSRGEDGNANR